MPDGPVGVIGARSMVGACLLRALSAASARVVAYTRRPIARQDDSIEWRTIPAGIDSGTMHCTAPIRDWIIVAPVWVIAEHFALLVSCGARRIIALSSTSLFVKASSSDRGEQHVAARLAEGEAALEAWAAKHRVDWLILRPTLIYGSGRDANIATAARFIRRFGFFPLVGEGSGLRQPVHAADVAMACVLALEARHLTRQSYNIPGADTITYREMIAEVFWALRRQPRFVQVPSAVVGAAIAALRLLPSFRHLTPAMGDRMGKDLVFDNRSAMRDFGFSPRPFRLTGADLPAHSD